VDLDRLGELAHDGPVLPGDRAQREHAPGGDELVGERRLLEAMTLNGFPFHDGQTGAPILDQAPGYLDCEVRQAVEVGNHTFFIGEVVDAGFGGDDPEAAEATELLRMEDTRMNYGG
ncbi:MAG: flavin reductase, partial [Actinomycetota bacterium]